jgi:hypothetical protein
VTRVFFCLVIIHESVEEKNEKEKPPMTLHIYVQWLAKLSIHLENGFGSSMFQ